MEVVRHLRRQTDAQRARRMLKQLQLRFFFGRRRSVHPIGQRFVGQAVDALKVDAVGDCEIAGVVQMLKRHFGGLPVPPCAALAFGALKVGGARAAVEARILQYLLQQLDVRFIFKPLAAALVRGVAVALHRGHDAAIQRQRDDAGGVHPVFEQPPTVVPANLAVVEYQAVEVCRIVCAQPAPQRDVLAAAHNLQRVQLHPADAPHHVVDGVGVGDGVGCGRRIQRLGMQRKRAGGAQRICGGGVRHTRDGGRRLG